MILTYLLEKSSQQPNLSHLKLSNAVPRLEGEGPPSPPLYRTGSDGDLSVHNMHPLPKEMFTNVEVGPSLRMAKSSSLESLQTVMHYTIRSDVRNGDGNVARYSKRFANQSRSCTCISIENYKNYIVEGGLLNEMACVFYTCIINL